MAFAAPKELVGVVGFPERLSPSQEVLQSTYALYWREVFLGTGVAIQPNVLVTAGHHFNMLKDDVEDFSVLMRPSVWVTSEYACKIQAHDVLVLWLKENFSCFLKLRAFLPPLHARVATLWLSPRPPHEAVTSPGVVVQSDVNLCVAQGTVSTTGSSGAPVVDGYGENVVGIHLSSNMKDGSRVSEFIPARKLVFLLSELNISCR